MTSNMNTSILIGGMSTKASHSHIKAVIGINSAVGFIKKENPNKEHKKIRNKANRAKKWNETVEDPYAEDFIEAPDEYEDY